MQAGRRQAENNVSGFDVFAGDDAVTLDYADNESGKIIFASWIEAGHLRGFSADQGEYDLAGFIVGVVERDRIITGKNVEPGDIIVGLPSNGLHTNGYALARKLLFTVAGYPPDKYVGEIKNKVGNELMRTHKSYWPV